MVRGGTESEIKYRGEVHEPGKAFWKGYTLGKKPNYCITLPGLEKAEMDFTEVLCAMQQSLVQKIHC